MSGIRVDVFHHFVSSPGGDLAAILEKVTTMSITQAELAVSLQATKAVVLDIRTSVAKIAIDTNGSLAKIAALTAMLEEGGAVTPEVEALLGEINNELTGIKDAATLVDSKVPDAAP